METPSQKFIPVLQPEDENKPYDFCANKCHFLNEEECDGPNFLAMGIDRLSEWSRLRKSFLHKSDPKWTNAYIAEQSGVSAVTVSRFLSGSMDDLKYNTAASIVKVLVNGSWGKHPCAMEALRRMLDESGLQDTSKELEAAKSECARLRQKLDKSNAESQSQIDFLRQQLNSKDDQIREKNKHLDERAAFMVRKDRAIRWLSVSLGICVLIVFIVLATVL